MQFRGLLAALIAAVVAGGLIFWSNKAKEADEKKPPAETSPKVLAIPEADITQVDIERKGGERTTLKRAGDGWEITSPAAYPADKDSVTSLVSSFASLSSDKLIEEKPANLAEFGLADPSIVVTVAKKDGKTEKLLLGDDTPTNSGTFVKTGSDGRVLTIASFTKTNLDKKAKDLRDKRLLRFDTEKLTRVELSAKNSVTEFAKNQSEWTILKPSPYRADGFQVEELIRKLKDAKLDADASEEDLKKAVSAFGGAALIAKAAISDNAGTQSIEVRKSSDNKYYAKSSTVPGVHVVATDLGEGLNKSTADFRNKKVFDFGFSDPTKVEYRDGTTNISLSKSGEKWWNNGKEMDAVSVQALIDKLRDLQASQFQDGALPPAAITLSVVSNEGKKTEKVSLAKKGDAWLAQRDGEPSLYQVSTPVLEEMQKAAAGVKPPAPPAPPAAKDTPKK